jgi:hypothetical protein
MKAQAEIDTSNKILLEKLRKDGEEEVIFELKRKIASNIKNQVELSRHAFDTLKRIHLREIRRAFLITSSIDAIEKTSAKDQFMEQWKELCQHFVTKKIPYLIALALAEDTKTMTLAIKHHRDAVIQHIKTLQEKGTEDLPVLIIALNATTNLLNKEITPKEYKAIASTMNGYGSNGPILLGLLMLALCVTCIAIGAGLIAVTATGLSSIGFFAISAPSGLSSAMRSLAAQQQKEINQTAASVPVP